MKNTNNNKIVALYVNTLYVYVFFYFIFLFLMIFICLFGFKSKKSSVLEQLSSSKRIVSIFSLSCKFHKP